MDWGGMESARTAKRRKKVHKADLLSLFSS